MIIQELNALYERLLADPDVSIAPRGTSEEKAAWEVMIDEEGSVCRVLSLAQGEGKSAIKYRLMMVPEHDTRTAGVKAFFLCDTAAYLLGVREDRDPKLAKKDKSAKKHEVSKELHNRVLAGCDDPGARAILRLFEREDPAAGLDEATLDAMSSSDLLVLRLKGDSCWLHERPAVAEAWRSYQEGAPEESNAVIGQCSVSGERKAMARLFPLVRGVPGAQSSGASLVSFNCEAFESYGKKQSYNAAISGDVAFGAGTALKYLLASTTNRIRMGDMQIVFWTDRPAPREVKLFSIMCGPATVAQDESTRTEIASALAAIKKGTRLLSFDPEVRFFVMGLVPNAARLAVKFFYTETLGKLMENYGQYLRDVEMAGVKSVSLLRLLRQTALLGKEEEVPKNLMNPCFTAMLNGTAFPLMMAQLVLSRMRCDHASNNVWDAGERASLLKAYLVRKHRLLGTGDTSGKEIGMELDRDNESIGYLLGRLFAVLERAQQGAVKDANATIRDRFFGSASTTPERVMQPLLRGYGAHLSTLRKKQEDRWLVARLEKEMDDILGVRMGTAGSFPKTLNTEEQCKFFIGYYQERVYLWSSRKDKSAEAESAAEVTDSNE